MNLFAYKTQNNIGKNFIFDYENFQVLAEDDIYFFYSLRSKKKSFRAIISKPNKTLWPNLSSLL